MELFFNELSNVPNSLDRYDANEKMIQFAKTFVKSRDYGFKRIRSHVSVSEIQLTNDYTVLSWLNDSYVSRELKAFMYGSIITPFINDADEEVEDAYIEAGYYYKNEENESECLGLTAAYLYESLTISLNSSEEWLVNKLPLTVEKEETLKEFSIPNVFSENCFIDKAILGFVENLAELELQESPLKADDKDIHLADHHGKDVLKLLCNKLKHNEFIISMRSTNWGGNTFIRKIHKNGGVIEITLCSSERRYALWVQTTGRNYRETQAIAKILNDKYS